MNKKGDAPSLIVALVVIIFVVAVIGLMAGKFIPALTSMLKENPMISENNNSLEVLDLVETHTIPWMDYAFVFSLVAIILGLVISSIFIDTHPALMIIFVVLLIVAVIFSGIFANAYTTIGESSSMLTTYNQFSMTRAVMGKLPLILLATGLLVMFILYGKSRRSAGGPI